MSKFLNKIKKIEKSIKSRLLTTEEVAEMAQLREELKDVHATACWNRGYTPSERDMLEFLRMIKAVKDKRHQTKLHT